MDKALFFEWAKMFCNWLEEYRAKLHESCEALLILDSHPSRASIEALELFKACNVRVITLPPHYTHAIQPFDVSISHALKTRYSKLFREYAGGKQTLELSAYRAIAVSAIVQAWKEVLNPYSAHKAFESTGLCPFSTGVMLMSRGVNTLSEKDPEKEDRKCTNRLVISSSELTSDTNILRLKEYYKISANKTVKEKDETKKKSLTFNSINKEEILLKHEKNLNAYNSPKISTIKGSPVSKEVNK